MLPEWDWLMVLPFGSPTIVALVGVVGIWLDRGASAGQVWLVQPLSSTASLCCPVLGREKVGAVATY